MNKDFEYEQNNCIYGEDVIKIGDFIDRKRKYTEKIRMDIIVGEAYCCSSKVRIWGQVRDDCYQPGVCVRLILINIVCIEEEYYRVVDETVTDCNGWYEFEVEQCKYGYYKVVTQLPQEKCKNEDKNYVYKTNYYDEEKWRLESVPKKFLNMQSGVNIGKKHYYNKHDDEYAHYINSLLDGSEKNCKCHYADEG